MKWKEHVVHVAEQRMLGWDIVFRHRWDHDMALSALNELDLRAHFEKWVRIRGMGSSAPVLADVVVQYMADGLPGRAEPRFTLKMRARGEQLAKDLRFERASRELKKHDAKRKKEREDELRRSAALRRGAAAQLRSESGA